MATTATIKARPRILDEGQRRAVCPFCGEVLIDTLPTTATVKCSMCRTLYQVQFSDDGVIIRRYHRRQAAPA